MKQTSVVSTASILPERLVSNREIGQMLIDGGRAVGLTDSDAEAAVRARAEVIEDKTGLRTRRFFRSDESPAEVALALLERLMPDGDWSILDAVIVSSSSTQGFPGLSQQVVALARQAHAVVESPFVLDINSNACTNFMYALSVGCSLIQSMGYRRVACLAVEFASRCIAYNPRAFGISTLFGDAAAGILLGAGDDGPISVREARAGSKVHTSTIAHIKGGGIQASIPAAAVPENVKWYMSGPAVAVGATEILVDEIRRYQEAGHMIDWLLPHQANLTRILLPACERAGVDQSRLMSTFAETGNTSSASIPLLLDTLVRSGKAKPGDNALLVGFGASFTLGSALMTFRTREALNNGSA